MKISDFLGKPVSTLLNREPFQQWAYERSAEEALEKPIIHYVFPEHGFELRCDENETVSVIFIFPDKFSKDDQYVLDIPLLSTRREMIDRLGSPSKSVNASSHPILGEYGAWDRFLMNGYAIRVEYKKNIDCLANITYMRNDQIPD